MRRLWVHWIGWLFIVIIHIPVISAQTDTDTRIISASIVDGTQLQVQVAIAPNNDIERVTVALPEDTLTLEQIDSQLTEERWILLDAGRDMLNAESEIRDEILALLTDDTLAQRTGLIIFQDDDAPQVLAPRDDVLTLRDTVAGYQADASRMGCVDDALRAFNSYYDDSADASIVRRVLLITGSTPCDETLPPVNIPLDILMLGQANSQLISLADQSATAITLSSLPAFDGALASVLARWQTDTVIFGATLPDAINSAEVTLELAGGQTIVRSVPVVGTFAVQATPMSIPSSTPTITPTQTPQATRTPSPTDTAADDTADDIGVVVTSDRDDETPAPTTDNSNFTVLLTILVSAVVAGVLVYVARSRQASQVPREETLITAPVDAPLESTQQIALARLQDMETGVLYSVFIPATILGRGGESTLIINDDRLSREHVRFTEIEKHGLLMTRLTQADVLVNGEVVERAQQLYVGDEITLSPNTSLLVERIDDDI